MKSKTQVCPLCAGALPPARGVRVRGARLYGPAGPLALGPVRTKLFYTLLRAGGETLSSEELESALYDEPNIGRNLLNAQISGLRAALRDAGLAYRVAYVPGAGYRLEEAKAPRSKPPRELAKEPI